MIKNWIKLLIKITFVLINDIMSRILTGVQSTGVPHLGNLLGAIIPAIQLAKRDENESFLFIADLHSLTQVKKGKTLKDNTFYTAASWLACGLNPNKTIFYRQSDVSQVTELSWYLSCFFPYQRLTLAHSLRKQIMSIATDSTPIKEPKNPENCTIFKLYSLLASSDKIDELKNNYLSGGIGYGSAKELLYQLILEKFKSERIKFEYYNLNPQEVNFALKKGAEKARKVANDVLLRTRDKIGY